MKRRTLLLAIALLSAAACSQPEAPTNRYEPDIGSEHGTVVLTFDQAVRMRTTSVFVGTVLDVLDEEPFQTEDGDTFRQLRVRVDDVIEGTFPEDSEIPFLQTDRFGPASRITQSDVESQGLFVGTMIGDVRSRDGTRIFPSAFAPGLWYSYLKVELPGGLAWGVRLFSPLAERFGYQGNRAELVSRLSSGQSLRPVDASPWADLLERARNPAARLDNQLGREEVTAQQPQQLSPEPEESDDAGENEKLGNEPNEGPAPGEM